MHYAFLFELFQLVTYINVSLISQSFWQHGETIKRWAELNMPQTVLLYII